MPYTGQLFHNGTGLIWTGQGVVTGTEMIQAGELELALSPTPERITHALVDFTLATAVEVSTEEVLRIGEIDRRNAKVLQGLYMAIVVPTSLGQYLARVYEDLSAPQDWTVSIFQTREAAEAWLASVVTGLSLEG